MTTNNAHRSNNNNRRNNNNNRKGGNKHTWTAYKNHPRSTCITVYDIQGSPVSEDVINRIVRYAEESIKASGVESLAIAINKG